MLQYVSFEVTSLCAGELTLHAKERFLSWMCQHVFLEASICCAFVFTLLAAERLFPSMNKNVSFQITSLGEHMGHMWIFSPPLFILVLDLKEVIVQSSVKNFFSVGVTNNFSASSVLYQSCRWTERKFHEGCQPALHNESESTGKNNRLKIYCTRWFVMSLAQKNNLNLKIFVSLLFLDYISRL